MDGYNTEKLTLQDYEAEGLCSGCMFYGAVDVDGRLGCSFHWFDDESEDWNYSKNCDEAVRHVKEEISNALYN